MKQPLQRLREALRPVTLSPAYRLIRSEYRSTPLGCGSGASRFGDPKREYAVLYAAETTACCAHEVLVRGRFVGRTRRTLKESEVRQWYSVVLITREPILLLDLTCEPITALGVSPATVRSPNHRSGRALSHRLYHELHSCDGILYRSYYNGELCCAVFDRAVRRLAHAKGPYPLLGSETFQQMVDDLDIVLERDEHPRRR